jgi:hypothetical protein
MRTAHQLSGNIEDMIYRPREVLLVVISCLWWLEAKLVIENEDEERRGTDVPREVDEGETMNVVES